MKIKLEDITFESKLVLGPTESYPLGKAGCEMVAFCLMPYDAREIVYVEHDFTSQIITDTFKQRALVNMNKAWVKYENKLTTKIKRFIRKWILIPKNRIIG